MLKRRTLVGIGMAILMVAAAQAQRKDTKSNQSAAGAPPGVVYLAGSKPRTGTLDEEKKLVQQVKYGGKGAVIVYREGSTAPEWHDRGTHLIVVQNGEGTLILGGEIVDRRHDPKAAGKDIGTSIRNGVEYTMRVGDVVYIPAKTPHQYLVQPGKHMTHFVINENEP